MTDQLSLSLTGDVSRLPRSIRPMQARPADEPFDSPDHLFEPRWGGLRALAFLEPDGNDRRPRFRLLDESGRDLAPHLPELESMPDWVGERPCVLDGELIVPDRTGRMDEDALAGRIADGQTTGLAPVYLAFDLVWVRGRPILAQPLVRRRELLARIVEPTNELLVVPGVVLDGRDLFDAVVEQGLRGVMARHLRSPYLAGRHSELWRWVPAEAAHGRLHAVPDPLPPTPRPVLALIQRLPLDE